jgi:hypothetical protein
VDQCWWWKWSAANLPRESITVEGDAQGKPNHIVTDYVISVGKSFQNTAALYWMQKLFSVVIRFLEIFLRSVFWTLRIFIGSAIQIQGNA